MRTIAEWYEWMRRDSLAQISALEAKDRLIAKLLEDGEMFEDNGERIASLRRHIAELDQAIRRLHYH
jgi:hypothetical protein